jgi:hypothetical protein
MNIIFTVCNRHTYTNARVLAESVQKFHPEVLFYMGWVDTLALPELPSYCKVLTVENLKIPAWEAMCNWYYDFELVNACRPWFAKFLLTGLQEGETITFLAPTTVLYSSLDNMYAADKDLFLTPNITSPIPKNEAIDDKRILNVGMFNANAWAMRKCAAIINLLDWWAHRTIDRAKFDLCNGMCMDQLWLNFMPVWIEQHAQWSKPVWSYGLRSIPNHDMGLKNGIFEIKGEKLISIDFAGLTAFDPIWSNHIQLVSKNTAFQTQFRAYRTQLKRYKIEIGNKAPLGIVTKPVAMRLFRKNMVTKLKQLLLYIDQF